MLTAVQADKEIKMITYECCRCQEEFTEVSPIIWAQSYLCNILEYACKKCVDNNNGPDDEYYENFYESNMCKAMKDEQDLINAGRL